MELLEQRIKEYIASIPLPDEVKPEAVKEVIEQSGFVTAGMFLKRLKELKLKGSEFLELLGNSKIGNMEFRRIEENPHLKFDELLRILDNSSLDSDDYRMMISVAAQRQKERADRQYREEETLRRVQQEQAEEKKKHIETEPDDAVAVSADDTDSLQQSESVNEQLVQENSAVLQNGAQTAEEPGIQQDEAADDKLSAADEEEDNPDTEDIAVQEPEKAEESKAVSTDYDEFEKFLADNEHCGASAEEIGSVIGELMDECETAEEPPSRRSRKALIAAFTAATLIIAAGCTLRALQYYGIIPSVGYDVRSEIKQNIIDYTTLLDEAGKAEGRVSYELPQSFMSMTVKNTPTSAAAAGKEYTVTAAVNGDSYSIYGVKADSGKLTDSFCFDVELSDVSVIYFNGKFVIIGQNSSDTVINVYNEADISSGKPAAEYKQSGELYGYYADSERIYAVTRQSFDLSEASADRLKSFVPVFDNSGTQTVTPFGNIVLPKAVNKLNYATVLSIGTDGKTAVKSVLMGDAGGFCIGENGLYACDTVKINDKYSAKFTRIAFDKELTVCTADADGAVNPSSIIVSGGKTAAFGAREAEQKYVNTVFCFNSDLTEPSVISGIADNEKIAEISCTDGVMTLVTDGEKPLEFSVRLSDMTPAEKKAPEAPKTVINDSLSVSAEIAADKSGKRTGIRLTVYGKDGKELASAIAGAEGTGSGEWNDYLTSPTAENGQPLSVCMLGEKAIIGLPMVYFDGISQVSEYRFYSYEKNKLAKTGSIVLYGEKFNSMYCRIFGGEKPYIVTMWDNRVITADTAKIKIISDTVIKNTADKPSAE